jgi:hypothetical protein
MKKKLSKKTKKLKQKQKQKQSVNVSVHIDNSKKTSRRPSQPPQPQLPTYRPQIIMMSAPNHNPIYQNHIIKENNKPKPSLGISNIRNQINEPAEPEAEEVAEPEAEAEEIAETKEEDDYNQYIRVNRDGKLYNPITGRWIKDNNRNRNTILEYYRTIYSN